MKPSLSYTMVQWMKALKVPVSKSFLSSRLQQHPDYPSVLSITDALDDLGIDNMALDMEKENLKELPMPFLAHVHSNGGDYELITDRSILNNPESEFYKSWSGVVIAAEKPANFNNNDENEKSLLQDGKKKILQWVCVISFLILTALSAYLSYSVLLGILEVLVICGICISLLILTRELGIENVLADAICKGGKNTDCTAVIKSNGSKLLWGIKWSDIGITYFLGQWLALIVAGFASEVLQLFTLFKWLSVSTIPFMLFSVYYQWKVARNWCMLCLIVVALLLLQTLVLTVFNKGSFSDIKWQSVFTTIVLFFTAGGFWLLLRSILEKNIQLEQRLQGAMRLKNNTDVFWTLLQKQRKVVTAPFENELEIDTPGSPLHILVACNPYCVPCASAHNTLHEISEQHEEKLSISIRFGIDADNENDKKTQAVKHIFGLLHPAYRKSPKYNRTVLHDWFLMMDIKKFQQKYPLREYKDVKVQLKEHEKWFTETGIEATPTIFINGYQLPKMYSPKDLPGLVKGLLNKQEEIIIPQVKVVENNNALIPSFQ